MRVMFEQDIPWPAFAKPWRDLGFPLAAGQSKLGLPPRNCVEAYCQASLIVWGPEAGARLATMQYAHRVRPPFRPVTTLLSEGRDFHKLNRCLVPASALLVYRKTHDISQRFSDLRRVTRADGQWMGLPAVWKAAPDGTQSFALATIEAGPDIASIEDRQVVVLEPTNWASWLETGKRIGFTAGPAGSLKL